MSTNGRRAWRKWARTQRRALGRGFKDAGFARRHPFRDEAKPIGMKKARPGPLFVNQFTPRSLVGMSNDTRKWLARVEFVAQTYGPSMLPLRNRQEAKTLLLRWAIDLNLPGAQDCYLLARAKYRIGERLRPCPGCFRCSVVYQCNVCLTMDRGWCDCPGGLPRCCDSSGVIAARPRSARW